MLKYIFKKILYSGFIFIFICIMCFLALKCLPGDMVDAELGHKASNVAKAQLREKYHLDSPIVEQLVHYLKDILFKFDFRTSYQGEKSTALSLFFKHFSSTFQLAFISILIGSIIGVFLGIIGAVYYNSKTDYILRILTVCISILPTFVVGYLLQYIFSFRWRLLPASGFTDISRKILPVCTIVLISSASIFKITRLNMQEALNQPYIITAYAKGLSKNTVVYKHALKNAVFPIISYIHLYFASLLGGAIITEQVFDIKGIGYLISQSIHSKDNYVVCCCVILLSLCVILVNIFLDIIGCLLNPRLKL